MSDGEKERRTRLERLIRREIVEHTHGLLADRRVGGMSLLLLVVLNIDNVVGSGRLNWGGDLAGLKAREIERKLVDAELDGRCLQVQLRLWYRS